MVGTLAAVSIVRLRPDATSSVRFSILLVLALGYAIAADRVSILRRYLQLGQRSKVWTNQTSVWTFAATLTLPLGYAVLLVFAIYSHILIRGWQNASIRTYRVFFCITTTLVGVFSAAAVGRLFGSSPMAGGAEAEIGIVVQLAVYTLSSLIVAVTGIRLYGETGSVRASLPPRRAVVSEIATLLLGVVAAQMLVHDVVLTPLIIFMAIALHRSSMVQQLATAARVDTKTGLLNAAAWRTRAEEVLAENRARGQNVTLLLVDLDYFKNVNDTYGHVAGDAVLSAVGTCLTSLIRASDCAGRFGGEEFVVLLPGNESRVAQAMAERIRRSIAIRSTALGTPVTASIGVATRTDLGTETVDNLLQLADIALYEAKAAGRNRTHYATA